MGKFKEDQMPDMLPPDDSDEPRIETDGEGVDYGDEMKEAMKGMKGMDGMFDYGPEGEMIPSDEQGDDDSDDIPDLEPPTTSKEQISDADKAAKFN
jgi:hypothetical protein